MVKFIGIRTIARAKARGSVGFVIVFIGGCSSVTGQWRTVSVEPVGASFPIQHVTLDDQGRFTATGDLNEVGVYDGKAHTHTGRYKSGLGTLALSSYSGSQSQYRVTRRLDGKLVLSYHVPGDGKTVRATLEPAKE